MSYPCVKNKLRTSEEYANRVDSNHHTNVRNCLERLPMDLVKQVPFEYMHMVCLGSIKRFLSVLIHGKYVKHCKLSVDLIRILVNPASSKENIKVADNLLDIYVSRAK